MVSFSSIQYDAQSHLIPPQPHPFSTPRESDDGFRFYRWQSQSLKWVACLSLSELVHV